MRVLVERRFEVLYRLDRCGRLLATRDAEPLPAPRLHLVRSPEGNVWASRSDLEAELASALADACAAEPPLRAAAPDHPPVCREAVLALLGATEAEWSGPAYLLPRDPPRDPRARLLAAAEAAALADGFAWVADAYAAVRPVAIAVAEGRAVSICHAPRGATPAAAEAGVETLAPFRNRGLGTAVVSCWARAVQREGRLALYSTSWDNAASRAVARRLAAKLYAEDWHVR